MRRANSSIAVLVDVQNVLLSFGYDYCAEHEFGTARLQQAFGISGDKNDLTIQRYAVTRTANLHLIEAEVVSEDWSARKPKKLKHKRLFLLGGDEEPYNQTMEEFVTGYRDSHPKPNMPQAHWDEGAFLFSVPMGGVDEEAVRSIHQALLDHDALIYLAGSSNLIGGSGLVIARRSTIPKELTDQMEEAFRDQKALADASEATGIRTRVEEWSRGKGAFGKGYYALSPSWAAGDQRAKTKHSVIYFLNPADQQNNNFGWFTVEELELWMKGKGPIPKRAAA
jgi:hypothetical protein